MYLLSNTNACHVRHFEQTLADRHGPEVWGPYFHKVYYSCDVNLRKPEPEIFLRVLEENGLNPQETLFIDDTLLNIHAAQNIGIHSVHLPRGEEFTEFLAEWLILPDA